MDYSIKAYIARITDKLKNGNNWTDDYEKSWEQIYNDYNPYETGYEQAIIELSKKYLPK